MNEQMAGMRYNRGARALHWAIALLVIANLASGLLHDALDGVIRLMPFHKASGLTILALSVIRVLWRFTWRHPPYPATLSASEIALARAVQIAFYGLMILMPLTGWVVTSAGKYPLSWFGLFDVPKFAVAKDSITYAINHEAHELLGYLFLALVVLHIAAALRHHYILKDGILRRMI